MSKEPGHLPTADEIAFVDQWMETVDRAARGELDPDELDRLEAAARSNEMLREALDDARRMRPHFARMKEMGAGPELDQRILGAIDSEESADIDSRPKTSYHQVRRNTSPRPRRAIPAWGWTVAAAAAVVVLLVWSRPSEISDPGAEAPVVAQSFSDAEVEAAAQEMEMAMAMLGQTMQRTSRRLQQEMNTGVRETLNDSFRQGFGRTVNQIPYLKPSNTTEEHSGIHIPPRDGLHRTLGVALPGERT
jgi:hypothetical protein